MTAPRGRTGRPPLTDERRAAIRLEIARAAVGLFIAQGVAATTGEQIGQAVGVSARTGVAVLPHQGELRTAAVLDRHRPDRRRAAGVASRQTSSRTRLRPGVGRRRGTDRAGRRCPAPADPHRTGPARGLAADPRRSGTRLPRALAERAGLPDDDVRPAVWAAMLNAALRAAVEHHAYRSAEPESGPVPAQADLAATLRTALTSPRPASPGLRYRSRRRASAALRSPRRNRGAPAGPGRVACGPCRVLSRTRWGLSVTPSAPEPLRSQPWPSRRVPRWDGCSWG